MAKKSLEQSSQDENDIPEDVTLVCTIPGEPGWGLYRHVIESRNPNSRRKTTEVDNAQYFKARVPTSRQRHYAA